jgi:hypothetical protein
MCHNRFIWCRGVATLRCSNIRPVNRRGCLSKRQSRNTGAKQQSAAKIAIPAPIRASKPAKQKKGPTLSHRPLKSILGEDRHIGLIIVHRSKKYCNAQNAPCQKKFTSA